jgi:selenocysteine-specific elongation factor
MARIIATQALMARMRAKGTARIHDTHPRARTRASGQAMIIATAGHVDHGKTSLVRALTGIDTDRLPEEKARGLTIDLGFAYVPLPDGGLLGFVDVPGHQRFIKNMLAGVGNVDHALLVVAADDGVMPQTIEHVEILDLLGVARATVAITKIDKVPAGRCEEVEAEIRSLLGNTRVGADAFIRTSSRTREGIAELHDHIMVTAAAHSAPPAAGRFRMAVDRAFVLHGVGVVVTGSVHAGVAHAGDTAMVAPAGHAVRLRGLRVHDRDVASVRAGDRCAVNLSGIAPDDIRRGDWIVAGPNQATERLDIELRLFGRERPLRHWTSAHLHIGAEDLTCRVALLSAKTAQPGETAVAALHLDRPIAAWAEQKFILRDQSAQRTLGGGRILDPLPPARQNQAMRLTRLGALNAPNAATAFARLLAVSPRGFDFGTFAQSWNLTEPEFDALAAVHPVKVDGAARIAMRFDNWKALCNEIVEVLGAHHAKHPDLLGLNDQALHAAIRPSIERSLLRQAVAELRTAGTVSRQGTIVHLAGHQVQPTPAEVALWQRVAPLLESGGGRPPRVRELAEQTGVALDPLESFLARAEQLGWVHRVASNRFFLPRTLEELERMVESLATECPDGMFAAADFNRISGIGRNLTIQVLEYLDRVGTTQRHGDRRRLTRGSEPAGRP